MTVYRHHSCIIGNSQCQSRKRGGTFSVCHKLQYVTDKGDLLMESITFSRYCNIMINDVRRTPFSSSGSLCELQHSLSIWWPTTQQKILKHNGICVQCNSLHDLLQYAGHAYTPKVKCLISDFIELKMYMLKICLWQFRSLKHSSENSYWQPTTQAGQSNMDTKLRNFFLSKYKWYFFTNINKYKFSSIRKLQYMNKKI